MVGAIFRGAQSIKFKFIRALQGRAYHQELEKSTVAARTTHGGEDHDQEEMSNEYNNFQVEGHDHGERWIPHHRTGIYYPKGQEKVMEHIPIEATKSTVAIHWFSSSSDDTDNTNKIVMPLCWP